VLRAEPISESRFLKELALLELLEVASELLDVLVAEELSFELSRLVSESYADCAPLTSPELIALKRLSTSFPKVLIPESSLLLVVEPDVLDAAEVAVVLGVA